LHRENEGEDQSQHETRHGETEHRNGHDQAVDEGIAMQLRKDAGGDAEDGLDQQRRDHDGQGRGQFAEDCLDGGPGFTHRIAQVAMQDCPEIFVELHPDGLVQTPLAAERSDDLRRGIGGIEEAQGGIARKAQYEKGESHDQEDGEERAQGAAENEPGHFTPPPIERDC
jgi:hypothetical protein